MIICVANIKGGVGKTTSTLNLAACLGAGTLVVDLDPQGGCATSLGIDADALSPTVYDVLLGEHLSAHEAIIPTDYGFALLPSNIDLAQAELTLAGMPMREYALRRKLSLLATEYRTILIDTPPTLGLLTVNAFASADRVLIPVSTQLLSLRGLRSLLETIDKLKRYDVNDKLEIAGILPTKYDGRTIHAREVLSYLQAFGQAHQIPVFAPVRSTVRFDETTNEQTPFVVAYPDDPASLVFKGVADVLQTQTD